MSERQKTRHRGIYTRGEGRQKRFIVWFTDSKGKGHTETLPLGSTEKDALNRQAELRGLKATGVRIVRSKKRFGAFAAEWLTQQNDRLMVGDVSQNTVTGYAWAVERLQPLARLQLHEIGRPEIVALLRLLRKDGYRSSSIHITLSCLSVILDDAIVAGHLARNSTKDLAQRDRPKKDTREMRVLTRAEIETLLEVVPATYKPIVSTLVFTGMRISEATTSRWEDVDFDSGLLTVRESKTDAGRGRQIILIPALAGVLRDQHINELVKGYGGPSDFIFTNGVGGMLHRANVLRGGVQAKPVKDAIGHLTLHELRHTFASILIGQGLDVTFVANQLGHTNPSITLGTYAKLFDPAARRDDARERLELEFGQVLTLNVRNQAERPLSRPLRQVD